MSKIGKAPIVLTNSVTVAVQGTNVNITGSKGNVTYQIPKDISVEVSDGIVLVKSKNLDEKSQRAMYGLTRANLANIIRGVDLGFEKKLELSGVGYRAQLQGADLVLSLGFSHPVMFKPKEGIQLSVSENVITISGTDKALVGETAAKIRSFRPPEPYKGKGIKYVGERIRRKAGKAAKAVGATK